MVYLVVAVIIVDVSIIFTIIFSITPVFGIADRDLRAANSALAASVDVIKRYSARRRPPPAAGGDGIRGPSDHEVNNMRGNVNW